MDEARGKAGMRQCRRVHVRLSCAQEAWECAVRAYLLHLLGCTIFADKSVTSVSISYLLLFSNLHVSWICIGSNNTYISI